MFRILSIAVLMIAVSGLTGCVEKITTPFTGTTVNRDEESFAEFSDVPYPANMSFSKKDSFTYSRRGVFSGLVVVSGRMNVDELGAYYDLHLPGHGWSPVAEVHYSSALVSTWKKGDKVLTIIGKPVSFSIGSDLRVELWVAPPHTKDDLGQRVAYQKPTVKESGTTTSSSGGLFSKTTTKKSSDSVTEEDI
ncbi:hypothetical protein C4J81_11200 [Deltaproteobacteria bacterium Smac51]|nr:hypothetical protein C4J81_11200 [Deltaproteobacteria bacterium Smac51]